jgi:pyruvate-ferredoxin/flavodoxin oxidoreductase
MHVAARSLATHALSIFGDHSDVMAARQTGSRCSPRARCRRRRTSRSSRTPRRCVPGAVPALLRRLPDLARGRQDRRCSDDDDLRALIAPTSSPRTARAAVARHPVAPRHAQNPDTFFQAARRPTRSTTPCPIVADDHGRFAELHRPPLRLFDYHGAPRGRARRRDDGLGRRVRARDRRAPGQRARREGRRAEGAPVPAVPDDALLARCPRASLASRCSTAPRSPARPASRCCSTSSRRWSTPRRARRRCRGHRRALRPVVQGVHPGDGEGGVRRARPSPRPPRFTVGIVDDVTHLSLPSTPTFDIEPDDVTAPCSTGSAPTARSAPTRQHQDHRRETPPAARQGYFVYDSKKSGAITCRTCASGPEADPLDLPRSSSADFVAVHQFGCSSASTCSTRPPGRHRAAQHARTRRRAVGPPARRGAGGAHRAGCRLYVIDAQASPRHGLGRRINTVMQTCFFALSGVLPRDEAIAADQGVGRDTWGKRGPEVVRRNVAAIDAALAELHEVPCRRRPPSARHAPRRRARDAPDFVQRVTRLLLEGHGDQLPVSAFPPDGTWPTGTSRTRSAPSPRRSRSGSPTCACSATSARWSARTPRSAPRSSSPPALPGAPGRLPVRARGGPLSARRACAYTVQVAPDDCTGCGSASRSARPRTNPSPSARPSTWRPSRAPRPSEPTGDFFRSSAEIPDVGPHRHPARSRTLALLPPLFEFSGACAGCGETPYSKLLTQLFGDRLVIANATGCSSIYGGNLPTTPYTTEWRDGPRPGVGNSLFEDNAEFGLGMRLGLDSTSQARPLLLELAGADAAGAASWRRPAAPPTSDDPASPPSASGSPSCATEARRAPTIRRRPRWPSSPSTSCPESCGSSAATAGPTTSATAGSTTCWPPPRRQRAGARHRGVLQHRRPAVQGHADRRGGQVRAAGKETAKKDLGPARHDLRPRLRRQRRHAGARSHQDRQGLPRPRPPGAVARDRPQPVHRPRLRPGALAHPAARAIDSGAWPLYRSTRPRRASRRSTSTPTPSRLPMRDYMREEARFRMVELRDPVPVRPPRAAAAERGATNATPSTSSSPRSATPATPPRRTTRWLTSRCTGWASSCAAPWWSGVTAVRHRRTLAPAGRRRRRRDRAAVPVRGAARGRPARRAPVLRQPMSTSTPRPIVPPDSGRVLPSAPSPPIDPSCAGSGRGRRPRRRLAQRRHPRRAGPPTPASSPTAGAAAIELNLYDVATDLAETGEDIEDRQLQVVADRWLAEVDVPVSVKLSPFYASVPSFVPASNTRGGGGGAVQPLLPARHRPRHPRPRPPPARLSTSAELPLRLHALALRPRPGRCSPLPSSGGVHSGT